MPNRIIKESINESRGLASCTVLANDLFKRLITYADDYGRFNADTEIMLARLYPRECGSITQEDIVGALIELTGIGKIQFYTAAPRKEIYGCFPNWEEHQRVRNSKKKFPDPGDTTINDWYLRRFVSVDMKADIIERDGFKCQICGKYLTSCRDAKRFAKLGEGLYHIDHIVPCQQGGRATMENLRLTCPECNLKRKKCFTFEEIVQFAFPPQDAASGGEFAQDAARARAESESNPNPIRIQSESKHGAPDGASVPVMELPLNDATVYGVEQDKVREWAELYPCVDVLQELRNMKGWLDANPKKRKTRSGILRFINGWLAKEQDKGGVPNGRPEGFRPSRT